MPFKSCADVLAELKDVETPGASLESIAVSMAYKEKQRQAKGLPFNCFLLDVKAEKSNELTELFAFLEDNKHAFGSTLRFQILYRGMYKGRHHFSTLDIQVDKGQIQVYILEGAHPYNILEAITDIYESAPSARLYNTSGGMQEDKEECGTYSFDHICCLSKIADLHDILPTLEGNGRFQSYESFSKYVEDMLHNDHRLRNFNKDRIMEAVPHVKHIEIENFSAPLTPLLRNKKDIFDLPKKFGEESYKGNGSTKLFAYLMAKQKQSWYITDPNFDHTEIVDINTSICTKRESIKTKSAKHLETMSESDYQTLLENRSKKIYSYLKHFMVLSSPASSVPSPS